jgi:hypothetical protein
MRKPEFNTREVLNASSHRRKHVTVIFTGRPRRRLLSRAATACQLCDLIRSTLTVRQLATLVVRRHRPRSCAAGASHGLHENLNCQADARLPKMLTTR